MERTFELPGSVFFYLNFIMQNAIANFIHLIEI